MDYERRGSASYFEAEFPDDQLRSEVASLNSHLKCHGYLEIGDLSSPKHSEQAKTIKAYRPYQSYAPPPGTQ
jgi:hypothetical protein